MSERKDKKKVIGEPMTDEQIRVFLGVQAEDGVDADYHALERAYRSLREEDFARFLAFFSSDGRNLEARAPDGRTLAEIIAGHPRSGAYLDALEAAIQAG